MKLHVAIDIQVVILFVMVTRVAEQQEWIAAIKIME